MRTTLLFMGPVATRSGYGERARDLVRALIELDKYDISIVSTNWGSTPMNALTDADSDILSRIITGNLNVQPDIFVHVSVPNEFRPVGKFNIGVTAGIETDVCDPSWLEGCNRMNLILVPSQHSKKVFESTVYDKRGPNGQSLGKLQLTAPIEILFEGVKLDKFVKKYNDSAVISDMFKQIDNDFCFLFVGHWLPGTFGEDRKNVGGLIKVFLDTFKDRQNAPALVLKTSCGALSVIDKIELQKRIEMIKESTEYSKSLPDIYVVYADLTDEEMSDLYSHPKIKAHVSFTKGEGFGRPLLEAMVSGKPVIASAWSGQMDFLKSELSVLLPGKLTPIHPSAVWKGVLNEGSSWWTVDYGAASSALKDVVKNYDSYLERSRKSTQYVKDNFSFAKMKSAVDELLTARVPEFPKQMAIKLPTLKKVSTEQPKIKLPSLKKI